MTEGMQKWVVKLDDGQAVSRGSLQSAADTVRDVLKTQHSCEIWHFEDGESVLYERFEPDTTDTESPLEAIRRGALQMAQERAFKAAHPEAFPASSDGKENA